MSDETTMLSEDEKARQRVAAAAVTMVRAADRVAEQIEFEDPAGPTQTRMEGKFLVGARGTLRRPGAP